MQHTTYSYHCYQNPNFSHSRLYYQLVRDFWEQERATYHNSVTVNDSGLRGYCDLAVSEDKFRKKYQPLSSRFLGPFTLVPVRNASSSSYVERLTRFATYVKPVFGASEIICVDNAELQPILNIGFLKLEGRKIPLTLYNPAAGKLASSYSSCSNKITLRNLLTYFWASYPESDFKSYPFLPHFYRSGKELKLWVQKKVECLMKKFKEGNGIPEKGDGLVIQKAKAERGTRTLVLRVIFDPHNYKYCFELSAKGKPQKFELDETAEVIQAMMQNLAEDQQYLAMSHVGAHAALSIGVYFDGENFHFGEPRVQLISSRAGFQGAAFGLNIGLPEGYFFRDCRDRVKKFCEEFLAPSLLKLVSDYKHAFPPVFGVDFLAKRYTEEGDNDLRIYISEINLRFTAVSTTERLITTLELDDLIQSGQLAVLQLEHCLAPYIDSEFEVDTFYKEVAELLQRKVDPLKIEVLPVLLEKSSQKPPTAAKNLILETVMSDTVLMHPLSLPNSAGKFSLLLLGKDQILESLIGRLRKNPDNWVVDLRKLSS